MAGTRGEEDRVDSEEEGRRGQEVAQKKQGKQRKGLEINLGLVKERLINQHVELIVVTLRHSLEHEELAQLPLHGIRSILFYFDHRLNDESHLLLLHPTLQPHLHRRSL